MRRQSGQYAEPEEARLLTNGARNLIGAHLLGESAIDVALGGAPQTV